MHTNACNESLTLKVGTIQIRQLLRLYPGSWLEAGSVHIPELRINAKFDCHPPTPININEQIEFLRRHDQHSQRLHFLYNTKSQQSTTTTANLKRTSNVGLPANTNALSCACLGGSPHYYTLIQGEQFFKSSFRLSELPSFGLSLFQPDVHVIHSHSIFEHKYNWNTYEHSNITNEQLNDEEIFYPFDFCTQRKQENSKLNENYSHNSVPMNLYSLARSNSISNTRHKSIAEPNLHKRSSSSIPLDNNGGDGSSSTTIISDAYLTPNEPLSSNSSSEKSLHNIIESSSVSSSTVIQRQSSTKSSPVPSHSNFIRKSFDENENLSITSAISSSTDSLTALEEILKRQQIGSTSTSLPQNVNIDKQTIGTTILRYRDGRVI
jgi:hypothetical protein